MKSEFSAALRAWRRMNLLSQAELAKRLGVSQQSVSLWERGADMPASNKIKKIQELIGRNDALLIERLSIRNQSTIRTLIDTDGAKLIECSSGFVSAWPTFSELTGIFLQDKLINESQELVRNKQLWQDILSGELKIVSGVSLEHFDVGYDKPFKHRWNACFKQYGARIIADIVIEPAEKEAQTGFDLFVRLSDLDKL